MLSVAFFTSRGGIDYFVGKNKRKLVISLVLGILFLVISYLMKLL
jgi:uncharacterized membrane protein (UPF0136 family)